MSGVQVKRKVWLFEGVQMDADRASDIVNTYQIQHVTVYIWWDSGSTPVGEIQLWARVNPTNEKTAVKKQMTLSSTLGVTGNTGNLELNITEPLGDWEIRYVRTSGDAVLYGTWEGKSKG